jgi:hypothetical protein
MQRNRREMLAPVFVWALFPPARNGHNSAGANASPESPMKILMIAALSLVLGAPLIVPVNIAQDKPVQPEFALRLPASKSEKQVWKEHNVVRNGDFTAMHTAWRWTVDSGGIRSEAAREPAKGNYGADLSTDRNAANTVGLTQNLYIPDKVTAATLSMDWALFGNGDTATISGFSIVVGASSDEGVETAATPVTIDAKNYPGDTWQRLDHKFTAAELKLLNAQLAKKAAILLVFALSGQNLTAYVDNVSLTVDGEFTPPEMPGHIAFIDSTKDGYDLVITTPGGASRETAFSATGGAYASRGIDWRPDNKAICFASDHEAVYSWWDHDFYELTSEGLRRVSNGPSIAEVKAGGYKTGSVKVRVRNYTSANLTGSVYVRGGLQLASFSVGPKGTASETKEVIVEEVADLGEGVSQYVCARIGEDTELAIKGVDVVAGKTVELAGDLGVSSSMSRKRPSRPSYTSKGDKIAYEMSTGYTMDVATGKFSEPLKETFACWDPVCSPADDRMLFVQFADGICIHDFKLGKSEQLIKPESTSSYNNPVWIADASGFIYEMSSNDATGRTCRNIALYGMEAKRSVQITDVFSESLSQPTLSPDAQWMAVIRTPLQGVLDEIPGEPELWVLKVGEPHIGWRIETKGTPSHPCWSR